MPPDTVTRSDLRPHAQPVDPEGVGRPPKIEVHDVSMRFGAAASSVLALDRVSFDLADGRFVSIVGESGCGKTTLLRMVAGLIRPTAGRILIDGAPVGGPRLEVGFAFQKPVLLNWRTVLDNVLLPVEIAGGSKRDQRDEAEQLLGMLGLRGFEDKRPRQLSGGMQQRVAIARTLILRPSILLMDEPFGALDAITREQLNLELLNIWGRRPTTVLFITHDIPEAVFLSDEVILMSPRPGRVERVYPIDLPRPRTLEMRYSEAFIRIAHDIKLGMLSGQAADGRG